jgi:SPP1 family predicted phage head-tail adaptor
MRPGNMDRRITIKSKISTQNSYGEPIDTWIDIATVWAERRELRGDERWEAQRVNPTVECKYYIWHREGLTVKNRIVDGGRDFDILAVLEIGRREGLELIVSARGG